MGNGFPYPLDFLSSFLYNMDMIKQNLNKTIEIKVKNIPSNVLTKMSNIEFRFPFEVSQRTRDELYSLIDKFEAGNVTPEDVQKFVDSICEDAGVPSIPVVFKERRRTRRTYRLVLAHIKYALNLYTRKAWGFHIVVYTNRIGRVNDFVETILHELSHYFDITLFKFPKSYHTNGFESRLNSLIKDILGVSLYKLRVLNKITRR